MLKNIFLALLSLALIISLGTQFINGARASKPDKPEVHVFLPDGYCGEFVVFWGENTPPVDEPPEFLSYNIYPTHPNAVVINLPEPYERAGLQFIYSGQEGKLGRNPVFKRTGTGITAVSGTREMLENGHLRTSTRTDGFIDYNEFEIDTTGGCENDVESVSRSNLYFLLTGTSFKWIE
ncbi:hypothetical protein TRM7557_00930 [Tritonibacter multivorans]|uniref:Uncharacterized protein n=1 Tax=Tritonibacter multivorans TaxID=928856 RepID=A0A0P1GM99_9RHOB|nr:hypothetical protein [Tritonibacter multivorans]MDA7423071.1 hypothetical protein [Tritonibacter multivorans]CUH76501.1 hypothetical protein TRM7557_00930 [Tritonibacter multivorans]